MVNHPEDDITFDQLQIAPARQDDSSSADTGPNDSESSEDVGEPSLLWPRPVCLFCIPTTFVVFHSQDPPIQIQPVMVINTHL